VIIAGRSKSTVARLEDCLKRHPEFQVTPRVMSNGHADPLHGVQELPDLLLLHYGPGHSELQFLVDQGTRDQLPLIVCGPEDDPEAMRLAMRASARDYLPENASELDLVASLSRIREEMIRSAAPGKGKLIVVTNGKGGSGASFLATNLAHSLVVDGGHRVTLMDLDLQFGGLCHYLDITAEIGILQALEVAHEMDEVSAKAYSYEHASGLRLMAAPSNGLVLANQALIEQLDSLLEILLTINDYVVIDLPPRLDAVTELCFERADKIVLVTQQSLPHVQASARLLQLLSGELGIDKERVGVVVNRLSKNAAIEPADIQKVLGVTKPITIPNQFKLVSECIDTGVPVAEVSRNAPLTKGIRKLYEAIARPESKPEQGLLSRALPNILRR
jgi:pilus assembly protein CpaE